MSQEPTIGEILARALAQEPISPIVAAARGDAEALRGLANQAYGIAMEREGIARILWLGEAMTFARLTAGASQDLDDLHHVVFLYGQLAAECRMLGEMAEADDREAQGFLLAETAAELGDEEMSQLVVRAGPHITHGAHVAAHRIRESLS